MKYQIDQSGKIEQTNKNTVVAVTNGKSVVLKITSIEKQKLIKTLTLLKKPHKTYIMEILSVIIYIALCDLKIDDVIIDTEYTGHNASIKEKLIQLFEKDHTLYPNIHFGFIGKHSHAHIKAIEVFRGDRKANKVLKAEDVLRLLVNKANKKGWRLRSGRRNL